MSPTMKIWKHWYLAATMPAVLLLSLPATAGDDDAAEKGRRFDRQLRIVEQYERAIPDDTISGTETTAAVKPHGGVPALWINGEPVFPMAMLPIGHFPREVCRDFAAAGVHLYSHIIWSSKVILPGSASAVDPADVYWWRGPGEYDFEKVDAQIRAIIEADPQAYIFLRVKLNPPPWWLESHTDELTHYEDGSRGPQASLASEAWETTYERMLRDFVRHVESSPYAGHIIGYQPAGGESSEWFWWGHRKGLIDYGPAARERFRKWVVQRYEGDLAALREAWNDVGVTFDTVEPPTSAMREATEYLLFRDPQQARQVIDYQRFLSDITARNIIRSCRICKEETGGRKITGVFYGYSIHFAADSGPPHRQRLWNCGRLALAQVIRSPHVDFLCAPTDYGWRRGGEPGSFISGYTASYRLHGKLYWDEADIRTHLYEGRHRVGYSTQSLEETLGVLRRTLGYALSRGTALWWFTLAGDDTFHQDDIMECIANMQKRGEASMPVDKEPLHEVAVLVDEESFYHMRAGIYELGMPLIRGMHHRKLPKIGAPVDVYLLSDIASEKMPDYKLYIFLNAFTVDDSLRETIRQKVQRDNAVAAWFYAPGFVTGEGTFSEEAMQQLTGIRLKHEPQQHELQVNVADCAHPIIAEMKKDESTQFEKTRAIGPVFWAEDPEATVLGRFAHAPRAALVVRDFGNWRSVYCASPEMPTSVLRGLLRYAGVHVYSTTDDPFSANNNYLMLHAATSGEKKITLPERCNVYNVLTGELVGRGLSAIRFELEKGQTRIFRLASSDNGSLGTASTVRRAGFQPTVVLTTSSHE